LVKNSKFKCCADTNIVQEANIIPKRFSPVMTHAQ
jgi:hypothetical protein